jgi:DNA (cytosine-5)-methyltransferase 1
MKVGSLFSGIGGFELGLQMASLDFEIAWQVEQDEFCQKVLAKHWPDAQRWDDVKTFPPEPAEDWAVDLICGGWPCQPVSAAGRQKGESDERWLWPEFLRICEVLRPRWILGENVGAILSAPDAMGRRGGLFGGVLRDLASLGYRVEYHCIPAASIGALHRRDRVWLIGRLPDADSEPTGVEEHRGGRQGRHAPDAPEPAVLQQSDGTKGANRSRTSGKDVPDADQSRLERHTGNGTGVCEPGREPTGPYRLVTEAHLRRFAEGPGSAQWLVEPDVGRVAHGIPARVDRLRSLGNAVVPQVVEFLGRCIMEFENDQ